MPADAATDGEQAQNGGPAHASSSAQYLAPADGLAQADSSTPPAPDQSLQSMFQQVPPDVLCAVLTDCHGVVETAVDRLLAMTPEDMCDYIPNRERLKAQQRETLSGPLMPAVCTHVHCTSAFDERLYYRDEPQAPEAEAAALPQLLRTWKCVPMNGGVPCESPNEPAQSGAAVSSPTAVSVSTSAAAPDGGASAKMAPLPTGVALDGASSLNTSLATLLYSAPATFERTQGQVKETVIPLICEQLSQLKIPAMEQEAVVPNVGPLRFGTGESTMESLHFVQEDTRIVLQEDSIQIWIDHIQGKAKKIPWWYSKGSFPRLKDKGKASVAFKEGSIYLAFNIQFTSARPTFVVSAAEFHIDVLLLKITGSMVSWIYNRILGLLNSQLKQTVEQALQQLVVNAGSNGNGIGTSGSTSSMPE